MNALYPIHHQLKPIQPIRCTSPPITPPTPKTVVHFTRYIIITCYNSHVTTIKTRITIRYTSDVTYKLSAHSLRLNHIARVRHISSTIAIHPVHLANRYSSNARNCYGSPLTHTPETPHPLQYIHDTSPPLTCYKLQAFTLHPAQHTLTMQCARPLHLSRHVSLLVVSSTSRPVTIPNRGCIARYLPLANHN